MNNIVEKNDFKELYNRMNDYSYLEGKTVLLAGGTSFLFSYFIKSLLYYNEYQAIKKIRLIVVVRDEYKAKTIYKSYLDETSLTIIANDVINPITVDAKIDIIIHAASQASPKYYGVDPVGTFNANVIGTFNLLEFAKEKKVKDFIFISSGEVYGSINKEAVNEADFGYIDCTNLRSCYSEGKRAGETLCVSYAHQYGINVKIIRLYHTYGPGMPFDDGRVFADFAKNIIKKENIVLRSEGKAVRAFCYVTDMIDGLLRVLFFGEQANAYNIANPVQSYSIVELAEILANEFKDFGIKLIKEFRSNDINYLETLNAVCLPDISKAAALGFAPSITIQDGFRRVVAHYNLRYEN